MPTNNSLVKFEYINKNSANNNRNNNTIYFDENDNSISIGNKKFCLPKVDPEVDGSITLQSPSETAIIMSANALENVDYLILQGENSNPIIRNVHDPLMAQDAANKNYVDNKAITDFSGILAIEHGGTGNNNGYIRTGARTNSTIGQYTTIEGYENIASGDYSHAEGTLTTASENCSHAEGKQTIASGNCSHAEGVQTIASGNCSHAEGIQTTASGSYSHSEGISNTASGNYSHAEGNDTTAAGIGAHAQGKGTIANAQYEFVFGTYNIADFPNIQDHSPYSYIEIVGNGTAVNARSNARTLDWDGNEVLAGKLTIGTTPTADMDVTNKSYVDALKPLIVTIDNNSANKNAVEIYAAVPDRAILCLYNNAYYPLTYSTSTLAEFGYYNGANDSAKISIDSNGTVTTNLTI